jgi:class 3 adenylate cyclase
MARTPVTVLFADIADSTNLYTVLGDLPGREIVAQALRLMEAIIEEAGGRVIKTLGDEIMAMFDAAPQGAQAAVTMQERISDERAMTQPPLAIRVGMHTGLALLEDGDVYGDVVNTAARITSLAKPEQILATEDTVEALGDDWHERIHDLGPHTIRGKRGAIDLHEVVWSHADMTVMISPLRQPGDSAHRGPVLTLECGVGRCTIGGDKPRCTIGRSSRNDLVVPDHFASRLHVEVEYRFGRFILTDRSTNGTYVQPENGAEVFVRRDRLTLRDKGEIGLGRSPAASDAAIRFQIER